MRCCCVKVHGLVIKLRSFCMVYMYLYIYICCSVYIYSLSTTNSVFFFFSSSSFVHRVKRFRDHKN